MTNKVHCSFWREPTNYFLANEKGNRLVMTGHNKGRPL